MLNPFVIITTMKNEIEKTNFSSLIYEIRGYKVMLDSDLARLYGVETKRLKEQVRRNIDRFPGDFMFMLNNDEVNNLRSQIATSSWGGSRYGNLAFTEQGVAMLSSVLNCKRAIKLSRPMKTKFPSGPGTFEEMARKSGKKIGENALQIPEVSASLCWGDVLGLIHKKRSNLCEEMAS